jgi:hypothetical protein
MKRNHTALYAGALALIFVACLPTFAGSAGGGGGGTSSTGTGGGSSSGGGGSKKTDPLTTPTFGYGAVQTGTVDGSTSLDIGFNGTNCSTHGIDYQLDGVTYATVAPKPDGGGYRYVIPPAIPPAPPDTTYRIELYTPPGQSEQPTGNLYKIFTPGTTPNPTGTTDLWALQVPGVAMNTLSPTLGEPPTTGDNFADILINGTHNDSQIIGGVTNTSTDKTTALNDLVNTAFNSADTFIDTGTGQTTGTAPLLGSATEYKTVFMKYHTNADGSISEADVHWSGQEKGYGLLVVQIHDADQAQFVMSGTSTWTGLVVIVCDKIPTGNKQPLSFVGGGQDQHIIGGCMIYFPAPNSDLPHTLIGQEIVKLAGNGNIRFCSQVLGSLNQYRPMGMEVRSWRRLQENE